ncbi:MAG: carboxypeptidase regulatory-like domain-containing protein [Candidatus Magasanikbacteria bacterium]|nr:carboxypeptidase regulatory-like domain-containing protein [Candidatus Magasanikbacteria bacterium]
MPKLKKILVWFTVFANLAFNFTLGGQVLALGASVSDSQKASVAEIASQPKASAALNRASISGDTDSPVIDLTTAPRWQPKKLIPVTPGSAQVKAEAIRYQEAPASPRALRGATIKQLWQKKSEAERKNVSAGQSKSVSFSQWNRLVAWVGKMLGPTPARAATPLIAYEAGIEQRPLDYALYYLANQQNPNGSFGAANVYEATAEMVFFLNDIGRTANDQYLPALNYILNTTPTTTRAQALKARIVAGLGQNATPLLDEIVSSQNADGGYGLLPGYESDLVTTLEVALALRAANYQPADRQTEALWFALNQIPASGELRYAAVSPPSYYLINKTAQNLQPFQGLTITDSQSQITVAVNDKVNALLGYLSSQYDASSGRLLGAADVLDEIMTAQTWRRYGVELINWHALRQSILSQQQTDGSFMNSVLATEQGIDATALPDLSLVDHINTTPLVNKNNVTWQVTVTNAGYASNGQARLNLVADNVWVSTVDFAGQGIVVPPNSTVTLNINVADTTGLIGDTEIKYYLSDAEELNYDNNWLAKHFTFASAADGSPALPLYYIAQKWEIGNDPAVNVRWQRKSDPQRFNYVFMYREKGTGQWNFASLDNSLAGAFLSPFGEGITYEITIGTVHLDQQTITYFNNLSEVTTSADPNKFMGQVSGTVGDAFQKFPNLNTTAYGAGALTDSQSAFVYAKMENGTSAAQVDAAPHESIRKKFAVAVGATTTVALPTRLKEDTVAPQITYLAIPLSNFLIKNQTEASLSASVSDNVAAKEVDFYYWDPGPGAWLFLGTAEVRSGGASFLWYVPADLLGVGYKIKAVARDYRGNVSAPQEWGPFQIIDGSPPARTISGTIRYYDGVKTVPNATVILQNDVGAQLAATTTDSNGRYQFTGVADGGAYGVTVTSTDMSTNGVDSADQTKIGRHIVGLEPFDSIYKIIAGDVNDSGGLTSADQGKIGRFITGLDVNLPSGIWKFYDASVVLTSANYLTTGLAKTYTNLTADQADQDFVGIKMGDVDNSWSTANKDITLFSFPSATSTITGANIAVTVPSGTNVTALVPTIIHTGASVSPGSGAAQDFTNPVTYTVTALDGSTQAYTVTVTVSPPLVIIYEDGNDLDTAPWFVSPAGTTSQLENIAADDPAHGRVIKLTASPASSRMVFYAPTSNPWQYPSLPILQWDFKYQTQANFFISLKTDNTAINNGYLYLSYATANTPGFRGNTFYYQLDPALADGSWRTLTRNLQQDVAAFSPNTTILGIQYFSAYGTGSIDNLALLKESALATVSGKVVDAKGNPIVGALISAPPYNLTTVTDSQGNYRLPGLPPGSYTLTPVKFGLDLPAASVTVGVSGADVSGINSSGNFVLYESGDDLDTAPWFISPAGTASTLANVSDDANHGRAIALTANDPSTRMVFYAPTNNPWALATHPVLQWEMKYSSDPEFLIYLNTNNGVRYLSYGTQNTPGWRGNKFYFKLDPGFKDGKWHTLIRNLQQDVASLSSTTTITGISYFSAYNSGRIDNLQLRPAQPLSTVSGTVTDDQGNSVAGVAVSAPPYGVSVQTDATGKYSLPGLPAGSYTLTFQKPGYTFPTTLLTVDGSNPNLTQDVSGTLPASITYEDGSDGDTNPWFISPAGTNSTLVNIIDEDPAHDRVISLTANANSTRLVFYAPASNPWAYPALPIIQWDQKYAGDWEVLVYLDTSAGARYLSYSPHHASNYLYNNNTARLKMDANLADGAWHTITRDLQADFATLFPGVTITGVKYFSVYGTGRIDNLRLLKQLP